MMAKYKKNYAGKMMTTHKNKGFGVSALSFAISLALTGSLASTQALADDQQAEASQNIEKIAVVGTRSAPRSIGDSPVPIDIISSDDLKKNGSTDMRSEGVV